jgi:hypothetical protein
VWISKRIAIAEFHYCIYCNKAKSVVQFGRIVSLFPVDNTPVSNGFQTDIIGTSGSSGSAIVDSKGNVVGMALKFLGPMSWRVMNLLVILQRWGLFMG